MPLTAAPAIVRNPRAPVSRTQSAPEVSRLPTLKCEDLDTWDGRFEYRDGETVTAWMVREPATDTHGRPSERLAGLSQIIAAVRGSVIECFGAMDLVRRGEGGERRRILRADQSVYLHPGCSRRPEGRAWSAASTTSRT